MTTLTTERVRHLRTARFISAVVALDTVELLAERVTNLLSHGRRISITHRHTHTDAAPELKVGMVLTGPPELRHHTDGGIGLTVRLRPGLMEGFGFAAYPGEWDTEAQARQQGRDRLEPDRWRNVTQVDIDGGLPGGGPARSDRLVIRRWNESGVCAEQVIGFDYETSQLPELAKVHDELRAHLTNLGGRQPWDNREMFDRVLAALDAHHCDTERINS